MFASVFLQGISIPVEIIRDSTPSGAGSQPRHESPFRTLHNESPYGGFADSPTWNTPMNAQPSSRFLPRPKSKSYVRSCDPQFSIQSATQRSRVVPTVSGTTVSTTATAHVPTRLGQFQPFERRSTQHTVRPHGLWSSAHLRFSDTALVRQRIPT